MLSVGRIFECFFPVRFFFVRTDTASCNYEAASYLIYLSINNEARPREQSYRGCFWPIGEIVSSYRDAYRVPSFH